MSLDTFSLLTLFVRRHFMSADTFCPDTFGPWTGLKGVFWSGGTVSVIKIL
jgi:hypothetical protein